MMIAQPIPELAGILLPSRFYADLRGLEKDILFRLAIVGRPLDRHLHALIRIAVTSKVCPIINHRPNIADVECVCVSVVRVSDLCA